MKISHVNVRLDEGGAAKVALQLHNYCLDRGCDSKYYYGYASKGLRSVNHFSYQSVSKLTPSYVAIANYFFCKFFGLDPFSLKEARVRKVLESDVIHLHAVHSHMMSLGDLEAISSARSSRKIWTLHDYWLVTGRCAVPGICANWTSGCKECPQLTAYPGSRFDCKSARKYKNSMLRDIVGEFELVSPSLHLKAAVEQKFPNSKVRHIPNSIDPSFEACLSQVDFSAPEEAGPRARMFIIANDLSDREKTDWGWIEQLVSAGKVEVVVVGRNLPKLGFEVEYHGVVSDRKILMKILQRCDFLLFTSTIDNSPLVIIEALCAGLPVLAKSSFAADEILSDFCVDTYQNVEEIIESVDFKGTQRIWSAWSRKELSRAALQKYSFDSLATRYFKLYCE